MPLKKTISYSEAITKLSEGFINANPIKIGSFYEFVRDIWSQGYEYPEFFSNWLTKTLCTDVQKALDEGKHYVAVIPRGHLKSTILGHGFSIWKLLKSKDDSAVLYMSYSHKMAEWHISEIKKHIRKNPILNEIMADRVPNADFAFRYSVAGKRIEIIPAGLFSFKRGLHLSGALIADDLLRDPENPLNTTQLVKVEEWFNKEAMYIPNEGVPIIVMGTPMAPGDLLSQLQDDERFNKRVLPVFDPVLGRPVLAPEIRSEKWLLSEQKNNPRGFASEFMLSPYLSTSSYLNDTEIEKVENSELKTLDPYKGHDIQSDYTVAGFDIGKKRHPSHLSIFRSEEGRLKIIQIHSSFLDGWDYTDQVKYLNIATENFKIDRGYFDNTQPALEDRVLNTAWAPIVFSQKQKRKLAQVFEEYVVNTKIELIPDRRQRAQIVCVDNELNAPATPLGHGDAFWSIALAILAYHEHNVVRVADVGDLSDLVKAREGPRGGRGLNFDSNVNEGNKFCPNCGESAGWIFERKKCLVCYSNDLIAALTPKNLTPILPE